MPRRYEVDICADDVKDLRAVLARIARENGRAISIVWQPRRSSVGKFGKVSEVPAGYVVVSEYE